jgi:3-hydroxyacyl-CoA dehydrogenase
LDAILNEAVRCVEDGNKPEGIDRAMKICTNFPMGPLALIELAGADIVLHGLERMKRILGIGTLPPLFFVKWSEQAFWAGRGRKGFMIISDRDSYGLRR